MSGLIDTIVRRRRASASSRLGPPAHLLDAHPWTPEAESPAPVNGHAPAAVNGRAPEVVDGPAAPAEPAEPTEPTPPAEPTALAEAATAIAPDEDPELATDDEPADELDEDPQLATDEEPDDEPEQPTTTFRAVEAPAAAAIPAAPAEPEPLEPLEPLEYPPLRERIALRRRARHLTAVREIQLRDLGGFLLELHRFGRERPDLVEAKLAATAATDAELRSLHHRLDEEAPIGELRRPGIGGACEHCGAVHGSLDRFCASCGEPLR